MKFKSKEELIQYIALTMPDEYPVSLAEYLANKWIEEGKAIITTE